MEKGIKIKTADKHIIYGTLNGSSKKSDRLIIFVPGFTSHANEHYFYNAARFFPKKGFDTFRFNLYWYEKDARKLLETSISEHVEDLRTITNHFKKQYTKIYVIGHSLGAQVAIRLKHESITSLVLWEPSCEVSELCNSLEYSPTLDAYIEHSNVDILVGKKYVEDGVALLPTKEILSVYTKPIKVIIAGLAGERTSQNLYYKNIYSPKEIYVIKKSGHTFDEEGAETELFDETLKWLKKY